MGARILSTFVLLTITGLGLGALYFLVASGLSLIYGLMGVLNFAHGAFITFGAYAAWWITTQVETSLEARAARGDRVRVRRRRRYSGRVVELVFIRPLYRRPVEQVLVTVGLALALGRARLRDLGRRIRKLFPDRPGEASRSVVDDRHDDDPRSEHPERPLRRDRRRAWSCSSV